MKVVAFPYRQIDPSYINWGPWKVFDEHGLTMADAEDWNDAEDHTWEIDVNCNRGFTESVAGLKSGSLYLALSLYCPSTMWRDSRQILLSEDEANETISITVGRGMVSRVVEAEALVIGTVKVSADFAIRNARLASTGTQKFFLAQDHNVFTTSVISFSATARPNVPWQIVTAFESEADGFATNLLLEINKDQPTYKGLETGRDKTAKWVLTTDIIRGATNCLNQFVSDNEQKRYEDLTRIEDIAQEFPTSLAAAVKRYADDFAWTLSRFLNVAQKDPEKFNEVVKAVALKHAPL